MGTFSHWVSTIGSILAYVGVEGFLSNQNQFYEEADETSAQWETFLQAWHDTFGSNWVKISNMVDLLNEQLANSSNQDQTTVDLADALPERLQIVLKEKPTSFKIRLGQELKKHADECFGESNLRLEQGKKDRKRTALWRVASNNTENTSVALGGKHAPLTQNSADNADSADNYSVNSQIKNGIPSQNGGSKQEGADNADSADNYSVNSQIKNGSLSQNDGPKHECENDGNNYRRYRHNQEENRARDGLGSGLMPIENGTKVSIEFPASSTLPQPAVPLSMSNDQKDERIASYNGSLNQASSAEDHTPDTEGNDRPSSSTPDASIVKKVKRIRI
jgi:hypothetical protein